MIHPILGPWNDSVPPSGNERTEISGKDTPPPVIKTVPRYTGTRLTCHLDEVPNEEMLKPYKVMVSTYAQGDYEGSGYALILSTYDKVEEYNLDHCSCYGPLEDEPNHVWDSVGEYLNESNVLRGESPPELNDKFRSLISQYQNGGFAK
jgi:hypothetical protein